MTTVALDSVTKVFPDRTVAVDDLSLTVGNGEFLVLLGPSGCGKSTVLRMVSGLEEPTSGTVSLDGVSVNEVPPRERGVAMVFQDYALYPHMSVDDNIGFPLRLSGLAPEQRRSRVEEVAAALGVGGVLGRRPYQLSGGQRQRVAMGRAIVRDPGLFLMDEPLSNLDTGLRAELRGEIMTFTRELGVTTLYVTHDQAEALTMADRVAILRQGVLQDLGTPTEVYNRPATLYVASFLGQPRMNLLEAEVHVHLDRYVALHCGEQVLYLPWQDLRSRVVAHYHGERIVVGMRAEALTPAPPDTPGALLSGRLRYLEHHGHETLAFLDVGATAVTVEELSSASATSAGPSRGARWRLLRSWFGGQRWRDNERGGAHDSGRVRGTAPAPGGHGAGSGRSGDEQTGQHEDDGDGRHHRRGAEVAVRLAPYPAIAPGQTLTVAVDTQALHFFDPRGHRIDVGHR